jgi:hypothetical protein
MHKLLSLSQNQKPTSKKNPRSKNKVKFILKPTCLQILYLSLHQKLAIQPHLLKNLSQLISKKNLLLKKIKIWKKERKKNDILSFKKISF